MGLPDPHRQPLEVALHHHPVAEVPHVLGGQPPVLFHQPALAEEFIEGIPFQETRSYVMTILANREHYRRIYGLSTSRPLDVASGR